jgi:hydrogenase maturation protease
MTRTTKGKRPGRNVLVVGMGNPDRGDDGIGPLVVRQLAWRVSPSITLIERTGDALALIEDWAGRGAVVLVDAAAPGTTPGRVHRIDLLEEQLPIDLSRASTHAFGVADTVGLARTLDLLPASVVVYAIEGADFEPGAALSPEVAAAAEEVAVRIAAELCHLEHDV